MNQDLKINFYPEYHSDIKELLRLNSKECLKNLTDHQIKLYLIILKQIHGEVIIFDRKFFRH